jgi:hypothetical protein
LRLLLTSKTPGRNVRLPDLGEGEGELEVSREHARAERLGESGERESASSARARSFKRLYAWAVYWTLVFTRLDAALRRAT